MSLSSKPNHLTCKSTSQKDEAFLQEESQCWAGELCAFLVHHKTTNEKRSHHPHEHPQHIHNRSFRLRRLQNPCIYKEQLLCLDGSRTAVHKLLKRGVYNALYAKPIQRAGENVIKAVQSTGQINEMEQQSNVCNGLAEGAKKRSGGHVHGVPTSLGRGRSGQCGSG